MNQASENPRYAHDVPTKKRPTKPAPTGQEEIQQAVTHAARQLFASRPYGDVTTRAIAEAAGVNLGLLHRHFGSKENILKAVFDQEAASHARLMTQHETFGDKLWAWFDKPSDRESVRLMAYLVMSNVEASNYVVSDGPLSRLLQSASQAGDGRDETSDAAGLLAAFALYMGWTLFEEFILEAAGHRVTRDELRRRVIEIGHATTSGKPT